MSLESSSRITWYDYLYEHVLNTFEESSVHRVLRIEDQRLFFCMEALLEQMKLS